MLKTKLMVNRLSEEDILTTSGLSQCTHTTYSHFQYNSTTTDPTTKYNGTFYFKNGTKWDSMPNSYTSGNFGTNQLEGVQPGDWFYFDILGSGKFWKCDADHAFILGE